MTDKVDQGTRGDGISRRKVLGGAAVAVGLGAGLVSTSAYADKTSQADAKYQDKPQGSNMCSGCMQFEAPHACKLVAGNIDPNGWCILFTPKG